MSPSNSQPKCGDYIATFESRSKILDGCCRYMKKTADTYAVRFFICNYDLPFEYVLFTVSLFCEIRVEQLQISKKKNILFYLLKICEIILLRDCYKKYYLFGIIFIILLFRKSLSYSPSVRMSISQHLIIFSIIICRKC